MTGLVFAVAWDAVLLTWFAVELVRERKRP
jgi:hypothetical protein